MDFGHDWTIGEFPYSLQLSKCCSCLSDSACYIISSSTLCCYYPPRYVNLLVSSRFWPFTVTRSVLFPFILITLDFLLLTLSPALAAYCCSLRVFLCIICGVGDRSAMSLAKSRSFSFVVNFHLNHVSLSFIVFLITKFSTNRKRKPDIEHPCFTPVFTLNHSDSSPSITAHCVSSYSS